MEDRTVIEWNKDDLDDLGLLKIDVLGLGMLSCIRKAFVLLERHHGRAVTLATVPAEDPATYDMLCRADSLGVFQVESRAQMSMLPRLKPRSFYDLVIEVAIIRPGPIQGNMVHPYLRRRGGEEPVAYPSAALEGVLAKTLGVPLFQEQAMRIAVVAAGFTPGEADALRRAMAAWRRPGLIDGFKDKLVEGMVANGYARDFAERCFSQILGFGEYGFPESHAASFALLVYVSAWLKRHYPAAFACALLNSQPMGFYAPAQIVRDAREHGVTVRPADVNASDWDCTLEANNDKGDEGVALRLGLRQIKGAREADAEALVASRGAGYADVHDLARRAGLSEPALAKLARADALRSLGLDRRQAAWAVKGIGPAPLPLFATTDGRVPEPAIRLPGMGLGEQVAEDYATLRLTLRQHPVSFVRDDLAADGFVPAKDLATRRQWPARRGRRAGDHPPAPGDCARHHLRHARGRDRRRQPGGPRRRLRTLPQADALGRAAGRPWQARARGPGDPRRRRPPRRPDAAPARADRPRAAAHPGARRPGAASAVTELQVGGRRTPKFDAALVLRHTLCCGCEGMGR